MIQKNNCLKLLLLTILLNLAHSLLFSQPVRNDFPFSVSQYNAKDGLPQNQVIEITEWKDGVVVSTMNGLASYDGTEFTPLVTPNRKYSGVPYKLFYNKSSEELFGWASSGDYHRIFPRYEKLYSYSCASSDKNILVGITVDGLIRMSGLNMKVIYNTCKTDIKDAVAIVLCGDYYFVSDNNHLYKVNKNTGKKQIILDGYFGVLKKNPYANEVIAVNGDVFYISADTMRRVPLIDAPSTSVVFRDIEFPAENEILITSSRGLYYVKNGQPFFYDMKDGLTSGSLYALYYHPSENCIFVGTGNKGLMVLTPKIAKTYYTASETDISQSFTSIVRDEQGSVYSTASKGNIIKIDRNGNQETYLSIDKHVASVSWINNRLYIGTYGKGVLIYQNRILKDSIQPPLLPSLHVQVIYKDIENNLWIGCYGGIVKQVSGGKCEQVLSTKGNIVSVYELRNGNLCFGGAGEFFILNKAGKEILHLGEKDGLREGEVRCFYEDDSGRLWIGTYGGGLFVYDRNKLTSVNNKLGCELNQDIFTLIKSGDGRIFMSSNEGIWSVQERKLQDFYKGIIPYLIPEYYGEEAGIENTEFNGGFCNNYLKQDGKIWFPSIDGLVEFRIEKRHLYRKIVPKFKSVIINDTIVALSSIFSRDVHTIQFDFYYPSFSRQNNIYYQYKLAGENFPGNWSPLQKSRQVVLKMLPPGKYTFCVRAVDSFNDPDPEVLSYEFSITPYFYETKWFVFLLSFVIIMVVYFFVRFQIRRIQIRNKVNNTLLELKLKAIQSKMNPHFMFNSLNNIIYLLTTGKHKEAERLLEDFSLLLRRFLEKSDDFFISLREELEIIELYLSIQQKRYNYLFDYKVEYPPETGEILIPSMLIQPFVENAVIHGIAHSKQHCHLEISVRNADNVLEIRIQDNGIGRKRAAEINKDRRHHDSQGTRLINDKIRIMRRKYGHDISFQILDMKEEHLSGTIVLINIPVYDNRLRNY
ncbi:MAG: histidine kinase [Flavobacteriia bacterium]|nr:histidine kinase [Flavobacteriia bacterium]OJX39854.1 MAG: hypothetical protein BGO87_02530 [Flavobacteriia bacterium 40-80]